MLKSLNIKEKIKVDNFQLLSLIFLQLVALILISRWYELELTLNLPELLTVTAVGFLLNAALAPPLRLYLFAVLSMVLLAVVIGWKGMVGVVVAGTAITLIAALVKPNGLKYGLLGAIFAVLIYLMASKPDWIQPHILVLSTLGSMFVFRLSLFLYDKNYQKERPPLLKDITYFFMMPNMSLLLFPVVDYKLFLRNYYDDEALYIYKKGVQWIALGVFHLLVYRFIYYYILIPPVEVQDAVSFWHYATTNYLLIIRLSGLFHIAVGVLCLFGFNLPRVFDNYFLASGFADLWRRINIYFRDYVVRLFYYPVFFKLRKWGDLNAKVITILFIFAMTWFLHSFQWFWLRGFFPLRMVDIVFWGVFGLLVAGNAIWESKRARGRKDTTTWFYAFTITAQIIGMFLIMCILWSIWSSTTMGNWASVAKYAFTGSLTQFLFLFFGLLALWGMGSVIYRVFALRQWGKIVDPNPKSGLATLWSAAMIGAMLLLHFQPVQNSIEDLTSVSLEGLMEHRLNYADEHLLVEGYYEEILIGNELTNPVGELMERGRGGRFKFSEAAIRVDDIRGVTSKPNTEIQFKDKSYSVNQYGNRDREYPTEPGENTIRTAILGGSYPNGSGVADHEVFDQILEDSLNSMNENLHYEFWNYSHPGYDIIQCIYDFEKKESLQYGFHNLIIISQGIDHFKNTRLVANSYHNRVPIPYDFIHEVIEKSAAQPSMDPMDIFIKMEPYSDELIQGSYQYLYDLCVDNDIRPILLYWPTIISHPLIQSKQEAVKTIAKDIGFTVIDLEGIYEGYIPYSLIVSPNDRHPNKLGHKLVGDRLTEIFKNNPSLLEADVQ
nr:hypothetical protein [Saprospiraceae bacterium]